MKKLLSTLLVICLVFTTVFSLPVYAEGETEYLITNLAGKYKTQGRTVLNSDGVLLAHFPATGIEFNANCSGDVSVTFTAYKPKEATTSDCYFTVIVDGEIMPRDTIHITANGDATFKIAEGLAEGNHSFKIYRQNEIKFAYLGFKSITLNGEFLAAPEEKDMYIEYVGASQWGGAGNLGNKDTAFDTTEVQDATQGLTYLSAQKLDADWSVVSMAGTGAYWGLELYPMNKLYDYYGYVHDNKTLYDFENSRKPDYVVIGVGTNDVSKAEKFGKTDEDIYEAFNYFIRLLRMKNPNAKIIWVHGMMNDQATPYVKKVVEDLGGAEYGVYELHVEKNNDGAAVHPSVEGHKRMANDVAAFIESIEAENASFTSKFVQKPYAPLSDGTVIMESDFNDADGTNWQKYNNTNPQDKTLIAYMDDDKDGINDFVRLTSSNKGNLAILSAPFKVVPGKDYELSFWARISEESNDFFTDAYKYYPKFALYKTPVSNGKVTEWYKEGTNDYVYKQDGFTNSVWTFGSELYEYVVKKYTVLSESNQYAAYANMDTDKIYDGWTRVTYKFTGFSADGSTTATDVAVSFALPKASTNSEGCMFDIKDVKVVEVGANSGSGDNTGSDDNTETTKTVLKSDFEKDVTATSWFTSGDVQSKNDSTGDFVRLTVVDMKSAYVRSKAFALTPGNKYTLTYSMRIPEGSANYSTVWSQPFSPEATFYQINNGKVGDSVTTNLSDNNLYAHQKFSRRVDMPFIWNVEGYNTHTRTGYSDTGYNSASALYGCTGGSATSVLNNAFSTWKKVTLEFTATAETEGSTDPTIAVLQFRVQNPANGLIYDVKDVTLTETGTTTEEPSEPENPNPPAVVEPEAPEGAVFYESFENATDASAAALITNRDSWATVNVIDTDYASGTKSLAVKAYWQYLFIPIDKNLLTTGQIYEFSMDWKLKAATAEKDRKISEIAFVGYNPSKGEKINKAFLSSNGVFTYKQNLAGTGNWVNTTLRFGSSDYNRKEQYGIFLRYTSSEPYSATEDTLYIDNIAIVPVKEETVNKVDLKEKPRTDDTIKVLAFGNSFSNDSVTWLSEIAAADGKDLRVGNCVIGGCSIQRHYKNMFVGADDKYSFLYTTKEKDVNYKLSMQEALVATDWDYIVIQQVSQNSGMVETFEPFLEDLLAYFKTKCPDAEIVFHATWAYSQDASHSGFKNYNSDQTTMHEAIEDAYLITSQKYGYARIIPTGEAVRRARATSMGDNFNRDGFHLNDRGRILAALTWYEFFTGISALDTKIDLTNNNIFKVSYEASDDVKSYAGYDGEEKGDAVGITAEEAAIIKQAAHEAVQLFNLANETQLAIEEIGTVDANSGEKIETAKALRAELNDDTLLPNLQTLLDAIEAFKAFEGEQPDPEEPKPEDPKPDVTATKGDVDGVEGITDADAEYLLMYTFFPEDYPINGDCDLDGDGNVTDADAEYLLMYTFFPEDYPIK